MSVEWTSTSPWLARSLALFGVLACLPACGTEVDVGRNHELGRPQLQDGVTSDATGETPDTPIPGGDGPAVDDDGTPFDPSSPGSPAAPGAALTCYGPAPSLPPEVATMCDTVSDELKTEFAAALGLICQEHRLLNLVADACAYDGGDVKNHRRILTATPLEDSASDRYDFFAAYSVKTPVSPMQMAGLIEAEMQDPNFSANHRTIRNSRLYDVVPLGPSFYEYSAELANSAATVRFRARLQVMPVSDKLTVVFDYDVGDRLLLIRHKFMRLLFADGFGGTRIVGIDEKAVEDGGNHLIAYRNLMDVLEQRMEKDYVNAHGL